MKDIKKLCRANPDYRKRESDWRKKARLLNPDVAHRNDRKNNLKRMFGISEVQYEYLFRMQAGACAICGNPETAILNGKKKNLSVDHCHSTNVVRGLLCSRCNTALGLLLDDLDIAAKLVSYLVNPIQFPIITSSGGNQATTVTVNGKPVIVGLNAYIKE